MNRLRVLKQRAARGKAGICRNPDGWYAAHGRGWGGLLWAAVAAGGNPAGRQMGDAVEGGQDRGDD